MVSLKKYLAPDFIKVDRLIRKSLEPSGVLSNDLGLKLYKSGGKKIRPTLSILAGRLGNPDKMDDVYKVSASLELLHMATLVHDDIIDDSKLRRGRPTAYYDYGYFQAVTTGNLLLSTAVHIVSDIEHPEFHTTYSEAIEQIVSGELLQFNHQFNSRQSYDDYYKKIYRKTALLIVLSVRLGSYASHLDEETMENLTAFANHIGLSFQIIDDILDFTGDEAALGKPKFSDLANGHYTLPVLLLRDEDERFSRNLDDFKENPGLLDDLIEQILDSNALEEAMQISTRHYDKAISHLSGIREPVRGYLLEIAEKLEKRLK